jgi:hypothetical protein
MTNPDEDLTAKKLELSLAETNLAIHEDRHALAEHSIKAAREALAQVSTPNDHVSRVLYAQAHGALASALLLSAQTGLMLERDRADIAHRRAHVDHAEAELAKAGEVQDVIGGIMQEMQEKLREQGIRFEPGPFGGGIIQLGKPEEDE